MAKIWSSVLPAFAGSLLALLVAGIVALVLAKPAMAIVFRRWAKRVLTDPYDENLWELACTLQTIGPQVMVETGLRAETGRIIKRPFGSVRSFPSLSKLTLNFAQVTQLPLEPDVAPAVETIIGPRAARPLRISLPVVIGGMAYGFSLSEQAVVALGKGASGAGTCVNTGEGPFLEALRQAASLVVLQWNRGNWAKDDETLRNADAVEIQFGQGARGGVGTIHKDKSLDATLHAALGVPQNEDAVSHSVPPGAESIKDLPGLVARIREVTRGVPVGVKFAATQRLEHDLETLVRAGVDYVTICGAEGGTWGTPPALEDDFGLPSLYALARAGRFFRQRGLKGKVSLIADGGFYAPGDFLKAVALGADAVSIGTIALFALGHDQVLAALPWEPATQLVYYGGKYAGKLNVSKAALNLSNFLLSCRLEIIEGLRALGRSGLAELSPRDLIALDRETAEFTGVTFGGTVPKPRKVRAMQRRRERSGDSASSIKEAPEVVEPVPIGTWRRPEHQG